LAGLSICVILLGSGLMAGQEFGATVTWRASHERCPVVLEIEEKLARIPVVDSKKRTSRIVFPSQRARYVRIMIHRTLGGTQPCLDELEIYGPNGSENLALASMGAVASASSVIEGYPIHAIAHLNDGLYGNERSWIAATNDTAWAQIELPEEVAISEVVLSRDRRGQYRDRIVVQAEVLLSLDGNDWDTVASLEDTEAVLSLGRRNPLSQYDLFPHLPVSRLVEKSWHGVVEYAFLRERETWGRIPDNDYLSPRITDRPSYPGGEPYWGRLARKDPLERVLSLYSDLIERLEAQGLDLGEERRQLTLFQARVARDADRALNEEVYLEARWAKRRLFFRDAAMEALEQVLFAKRHPFLESHNYSEHLDGYLEPGGGLYVLHVPRDLEGRFLPERAEVEQIFDGSAGIVRDPVLDYEARNLYFAYRPQKPLVQGWDSYWHLYSLSLEKGTWNRLIEGPFHDFDPVVLPDGGLAFHSTRCKSRFLCWRPQAYVLYRMERDGTGLCRLSYANLSEWKPSVMSDGRLLWTRSEYLDKGADFGHTLWAIRPDGTNPELVFGNNTPNCYSQAHEVPGTREIVCTLMSHGDHHGPIALIDRSQGPFDIRAITNITPDTRPHYQMSRSHFETFRDPYPISSDHFLVSHNPDNQHNWGLYVIDRYGNRELLYVDPEISSKRPVPLRPRPRPPILSSALDGDLAREELGQFVIQDVYVGLGGEVARGRVRYLGVSEEVPAALQRLSCGQYQKDHPPFQEFYAAPAHLVTGPACSFLTRTENAPLVPLQTYYDWSRHVENLGEGLYRVTEALGWPSYVAKMSHGLVPVEEDGSANFLAPAGRQIYFQLLDENFDEIQRMRSVVQLQPGERRGCVGCHEARSIAPPESGLSGAATRRPPSRLEPPPWGAVPFAYERVVQKVWDRRCVRCHDGRDPSKRPDLRGGHDGNRVPASYRSLLQGGWVHYFDFAYGMRHFKAEPLSFGSLQSRLWNVLRDSNHAEVVLTQNETRAIKAWIDLNCPLWPDYTYRLDRPSPAPTLGREGQDERSEATLDQTSLMSEAHPLR